MERSDPHEPTKTLDEPTTPPGELGARLEGRYRPEPVPTVPVAAVPMSTAAARPPLRSTSLTVLGLVWSAVLIGAGAVGIHDGLAESETIGDDPWIPRAIEYVDGVRPSDDVLVAAGVGGLVGLALVVLALWPRRRRKIMLRSPAGVYLRQRHLERVLAGRMETQDGVLRCGVEARRGMVTVEARGVVGADSAKLYGGLVAQTRDELSLLPRRPDIRIVVREAD